MMPIFPYHSIFIESNSAEEVIDKVNKFLPDYISTKRGGFEDKNDFIKILRKELIQELSEIFRDVKETKDVKIKSNIIENKVLHEENDSENHAVCKDKFSRNSFNG